MTESLPRNSPKMTLLDKMMARHAVIMKDSRIPAPATPASLAVGAVAFPLQLAGSIRAMMQMQIPRERMNERLRKAEQSLKTSPEDEFPRVHDLTGAWIIIMTFVLSADGPWSPRHLKRLFVGIYGVDCGGIGWQCKLASRLCRNVWSYPASA